MRRLWTILGLAATLCVGMGGPAQAAFLGLAPGDLIDKIGFTIPAGGASFTDATDQLDINGVADDITTTTPEVLTQINGGSVSILLDVDSESLTFIGGTFFQYDAIFSGRSGVLDPVRVFAPSGGPAPEQDGRLLVSGAFLSNPNSSLTVVFDSSGTFGPTFTFGGTFDVTGGDATFLQAFGSVGNLADVLAASSSSLPTLATLLADGHLFSQRDTDLAACAAGGSGTVCGGNVVGLQDWTASGTGEILPQNPAPFVPEPGTFLLVSTGLLGLAYKGRQQRRSRC